MDEARKGSTVTYSEIINIEDTVFDSKVKYPDEFYESYIKSFEKNTKKRFFYLFVKRSIDLLFSFLGLLILSPIMLIIAIAIKCDSKGPVIFKQKRMGRNGKVFSCYKFRSMRIDAPHDCATSCFENPEDYYTKVGRLLRRLSLDEIPQLVCCLVGTMSLIGYRPVCLTEEKCNRMRQELGVFRMRPGISGYAQVHGRDNVYYKNKVIMDAEYVKIASLRIDIMLLFQTVKVVLTGRGNDAKTNGSGDFEE